MYLVCSDLEGVFVPEVWINVAEKTGIDILRRTTRDEPDYNKLMKWRIKILEEHGLTLADIQHVIAQIKPLDGAVEFIDWIKSRSQLIVVSDTFAQFADPLMQQLNRPTLFCHQLVIDKRGMIADYKLRQEDPKRKVVEALQSLQYKVVAFGDSYNDTSMLLKADAGILFRPPQNVIDEFSQLPVTNNYDELRSLLSQYI
jgi:phosphoserine/homoserine phosphotransferase